MSRSWLIGEPGQWRMFCDVCFAPDGRTYPAQPDLAIFFAEGWFIGQKVDACVACVTAGNLPNDQRHLRFLEPGMVRLPPMWGLWLIDPSGKYGPHKAFYEHGETAAEAVVSAIARYRVEGVTEDLSRRHFLAGAACAIRQHEPPAEP